jgi:hypothetical protein
MQERIMNNRQIDPAVSAKPMIGSIRFDGASVYTWERRVIARCADVLFPRGGALKPWGWTPGGGVFGNAVSGARADAILPDGAFVQLCLLLMGPLWGPFLVSHERGNELRGHESRFYFRTAFLGLRTMLTIAYFASDRVNEALGNKPMLNPFDLEERAA